MKSNQVLDSWQEEVLSYKGNFLLCTGRQVGKTFILARKCAEFLRFNSNKQILVVSLTEDQARLIILMILDYLETFFSSSIAKKSRNRPQPVTQNKVELKNGSRVIARPVGQTGDSVRGFTGDVLVLDEASRLPDLAMEASMPTLLTTNGQIWMCSTPFGKKGFFYDMFKQAMDNPDNARFKVWHLSSEEVIFNRPISEGWTEEQRKGAIEFLNHEKRDKSELSYGQEYLGLFLEDLQQYFSDELINKACTLKRPDGISKNSRYFMGVDIARLGGDESAYQIIQRTPTNFFHVESITKTKLLTTQTTRDIIDLTKRYNLALTGIDAGSGSLGVGIFDWLMEDSFMKRRVIAMNNRVMEQDRWGNTKRKVSKEDYYEHFKGMLERGEIKLLDDEKVRASLKSVQFEFVKQHDQPTFIRIFGAYTHIAEGLVRAAWIAKKEKNIKVWFDSFSI